MSDLDQLLSEGITHFQANRHAEAEGVFKRLLTVAPQSAEVIHLYGLVRARLEGPEEAALLMRKALAVQPNLAAAHLNLGNQLGRQKRFGESVPSYRRAFRLAPNETITRDNLQRAFQVAAVTEWAEQEMADDEDVVIYQPHSGLGDNLLYTTLPELFARQGRRVFISDLNQTRNPEIDQLVWKLNPYISGVSAAPTKAGTAQLSPKFESLSHIPNWLTRIEVAHGFAPSNDLPKVYYKPKAHPALAGRVVVDTNSSTVKYPPEMITQFVRMICQRFHYRPEELVQLRFARNDIAEANGSLPGVPFHTITSIFELCDALASAKAFITVHSGANSLAAALKGDNPSPNIHCAVDAEHYNQKCYIWRNIDYSIVQSLPSSPA